MKIKHSKYKNTGVLFELLVRQITADTLKGSNSPAIDILKEYFVKTSLGREYKLYESVLKSNVISEGRANTIISTILENSKRFSRSSLKKQKYNLINEIKKHYDLDVFFGSKIKNYKELAALYTLIEGYNQKTDIDSQQLINNKITLLEHLTKKQINADDIKDKAIQIKLTEVNKFLVELNKTDKVSDDNLVDLLRFYELIKEIKVANGVQI